MRDPLERRPHLLYPRGKIRGIDEDPGGAVPKDIDHLRRGQAEIDGRHDRPDLGTCKEYFQKLRGIAHQNGHPFALDDSPTHQRMGHPVHPLVEVPIREDPLALLRQEKAVRIDRRPLGNPFTDIHPISPTFIYRGRITCRTALYHILQFMRYSALYIIETSLSLEIGS